MEYNELTQPFVAKYIERFGELPIYTADIYAFIRISLPMAIEEAGSLNPDKLIPLFEQGVSKVPAGVVAFEKDEQGRHLHELKWGPGYTTFLGTQWQDGKLVGVWPHYKWMSPYWEFSVEPPESPNEMTIKGLKPLMLPPWVVAAYKKK